MRICNSFLERQKKNRTNETGVMKMQLKIEDLQQQKKIDRSMIYQYK